MKIDRIQNFNKIYRYPQKNTSNNKNTENPNITTGYVYNPAYYIPFKGGYSLNLTETVRQLDRLALKNLQIYPPNIREWLGMILEAGNGMKRTLISAHKEYFSELKNCSSLIKIKEKFPEFKDVISVYDVETGGKRESFITKFLRGETEYFADDEDLTVQLIKLYWGEGFSLTDLKKYSDGCDLYYTMKKLNIPLASRDYGHILKFSDPEYNERLTREMSEKHLAALDRKAQALEGDHVYIKRGPMSDEDKKKTSEDLVDYYENKHPERVYGLDGSHRKFLSENEKLAETFRRVVKKTWSLQGSERIKAALSRYFGKKNVDKYTEIDPITFTRSEDMQRFWAQNQWAQELFSKLMKNAWKIVKRENETFYTIKSCPTPLVRYIEKEAGLAPGTVDLSTKYNPFTKESYINEEFNELSMKYTKIDGIEDVLADTYQIAVLRIKDVLKDIHRSNRNRPFNDLYDAASAIVALNRISAKNGYLIQSTREAQLDYIALATQAAESKCEELVEIVEDALDYAFTIAVEYHKK